MKKLIFSLFLLMMLSGMFAQTSYQKWGLGIIVGKTEYNGDLGNGFFKLDPSYPMFGLSLSRYLNPSFDITLQGDFGYYGYEDKTVNYFLARKLDADLLLKFKFNNGTIIKEDALLGPYLAAGAGLAGYSDHKTKASGTDAVLPLGGGIKFNFFDDEMFDLQYQFLYNITTGDKADMREAGSNDRFITHALAFIINLGAPRDTDKDGVPDKVDKCPGTPAGVRVDAQGCPWDSDKDGIADHLDKCPAVAGIAAFNGCPDTDGDGIQDSDDNCPDVKGLASLKGCPDRDGDGIKDSDDECPDVKGLAALNGCPDRDGDGIKDSDDRCPDVKGLKEFRGCPDSDGDGIPDIDDKCPAVAGIPENKGCPAVKEETIKVFTQALTGILFETGKDIIRKTSYPILDNVVDIMRNNPEYNLEINGHTDNVGDDAKNLDLSERRANSVKNYLVSKGINEARLMPRGYGETRPVADNNTAAGRTKNRRVEFKVVF